jgi:hypothetical protein
MPLMAKESFLFLRGDMHDGDMIFRKENLAIDSSNRIP